MSSAPPLKFNINFEPQTILKDAEEQMLKAFKARATSEINSFFSENETYRQGAFEKNPGVGLLLIRDFLEKKFDDPKTKARMEKYFEDNFERIMEESMQKAMQHKANAFVFAKAKEK